MLAEARGEDMHSKESRYGVNMVLEYHAKYMDPTTRGAKSKEIKVPPRFLILVLYHLWFERARERLKRLCTLHFATRLHPLDYIQYLNAQRPEL